MPHPFDATTKYLIESHPADWLALSGRTSSGPVELLEAELSTVTAAADKVIRVLDPSPWLLHLEPQASREPDLAGRLHLYNALLERKFGLPVWTVLVLLRTEADAPELTGEWQRRITTAETAYQVFRYGVVRLWELSPDTFLNGGLGIVPLAPLGSVDEQDLPSIIRRLRERINREGLPGEVGELWTAVSVLMELRYSEETMKQLLQELPGMEETVFYRLILKKGALKEASRLLLRLGEKRLGPPDEATRTAIEAMNDIGRLELLLEKTADASSWQELLQMP